MSRRCLTIAEEDRLRESAKQHASDCTRAELAQALAERDALTRCCNDETLKRLHSDRALDAAIAERDAAIREAGDLRIELANSEAGDEVLSAFVDCKAERDASRAVLRSVEWSGPFDGDCWCHECHTMECICPACEQRQCQGHDPDCALAAALGDR